MMWSRECHTIGKHVPLCTLCIQGPARFCAWFHASLKSIWPPTHSVSSLCHIFPCAGHVTHPTEVVVDQTENKRQQA